MYLVYMNFILRLLINNIIVYFLKNIDNYTSHKNYYYEGWVYQYNYCVKLLSNYSKLTVAYLIIKLSTVERYNTAKWKFSNPMLKFILISDEWILLLSNFFLVTRYVNLSLFRVKHTKVKRRTIFYEERFLNYLPSKKVLTYIYDYIYNYFKLTIVSLCTGFILFLYLVYFYQLQLVKQLAVWFIIVNLFFWLFSGFNFFLKRYRYGKFTSAVQRFWKRTNMCFWLIEGFLFLIFFYYFLNSSQEPLYMYDTVSLQQEYLLPLKSSYFNVSGISIVIFILYYLILSINFFTISQNIIVISFVSVYIFYLFFIESYQFYYIISLFNEASWVFSEETNLWELETDYIKLRTKEYYFLLCLIAKYWHFLFIFLSWVFFIIKTYESKKVTYTLLALNTQNFIILYVLNLLCFVQWLKWVYRRFFDLSFFWFFSSPDLKINFLVLNEIILILKNLFNFFIQNNYLNILNNYSLINFGAGDNFVVNTFIM